MTIQYALNLIKDAQLYVDDIKSTRLGKYEIAFIEIKKMNDSWILSKLMQSMIITNDDKSGLFLEINKYNDKIYNDKFLIAKTQKN